MELILELDERTVEIKSFDDSIVEEIKITDKFLSRFNK